MDFVTANGENLAGGMGLTVSTAEALFAAGVDVVTSGNHIWDKREIYPFLDQSDRVLRPLNYGTHGVPGRGWGTYEALDGSELAVINLQGRTFMQPIDNPFTEADRLLDEASEPLPPIRLVDFHCEITSEKNAFGLYLDGRVSRRGRDPHPRRDGRRAHPAQGHRLPVRPRDDGPAVERDRVQARHGPAPVHQCAPHPVRGGRRARDPQRVPGGHRSRRPGGRSRSSASAASSRSEGGRAPRRGFRRGTGRRRNRGCRRAHAHDAIRRPAGAGASSCREAAAAGVRLFAIADHDNLAAYRELTAPGATPLPEGLELVPAVEINAVAGSLAIDLPEGELHVLGIGVDPFDDAFEAAIAAQRTARRRRFSAAVERLRAIDMPVDEHLPPGVLESDDALGRPTLARALVAAGHADSVEDAFRRILGTGLPGYVPRTGMDPVEAIRAIRGAGGLASIAHFADAPLHLGLLRELVGQGLDGLETHHRSFEAETRAAMTAVARLLGLVETGGTDYHGDTGSYAEDHARLVMPDELVSGLRAALADRGWPARP